MKQNLKYTVSALALAALALSYGDARAADFSNSFEPVEVQTIEYASDVSAENSYAPTAEEENSNVFGSAPVSDESLSEMRGMALTPEQLGVAVLEAVSTQNANVNGVTGSNIIDQNAVSNNTGFTTIIQNSGNNTIIQNAMVVNLSLIN